MNQLSSLGRWSCLPGKKLLILFSFAFSASLLYATLTPYYSATDRKYGYKNEQGDVVVPPRYDLAYEFNEGLAAVRVNRLYGYIDEQGREVVVPTYDRTWKFIGGAAAVEKDGKYGFIGKRGEVLLPLVYDRAYNYHGTCCYKGKAHVKENGRWTIVDLPCR